jgi:EmrB/QacA subfamily drug resistance transporter
LPPDEAYEPTIFSKSEIYSIFFGLSLAMFLGSMDQTIVSTALTSIARDLDGWESMAWVVTASLITSTVTTPIYGRMSDIYGRRPILLISIGIYVVASALCALSSTMPQLIGARTVQGLGSGGLRSVSQAVLADIIPPRERGRYQGYFASLFTVSNALGPVLGGFFAEYMTWHWIFWINVPLGLAAFALTNRQLARLRIPTRRAVIDWLGAILMLATTTPILLGVGNAERQGGWVSVGAWGPIAAGLVCGVLLILRERVAPEPMLPLRLFRNPVFSVASLISFLVAAVMVGLIILVPLNYQLVAGLLPNQTGLRLMPLTVASVIGSAGCGWLITLTGRYRIFPIVGTAAAALICGAIALVGLGHSLAFDITVMSLLGLAWGGQFSPLSIAGQNALDWQDTGIGMSCLMFFRLIGGAFGVAFLSTTLIASLGAGALAVPGHELLGPNPGLALLHLNEPGRRLPPELLAALAQTIDQAFSHLFVIAMVILGLATAASCALKEVPLRTR